MSAERTAVTLVRKAGIATVFWLTGLLFWAIVQPGLTGGRLALLGVVAALAWGGVAGIVRERPSVAVAGGVGLLLLGFWQAVLWIFILPTAVVLLVVGLLMWTSGDVRV